MTPTLPALALLLVLSCFVAPRAKAAPAQTPPNIVILLADDAGWGDYGFTGNTQVRTPHIDSLARDGVTLSNFYVCPVCSPTRAELLTGRYAQRTGVRGVSLGQERLNLDETTLADVFQRAGYATGIFGKWHNGSQWPYHPMARGFDTFFGYTAGHWGEYFDPLLEDAGHLRRQSGYIVDICTDQALRFIEKNRGHPFLCYVPFTTPHSPWGVPQKNWAAWKDRPLTQTATQPAEEKPEETRCALAMIENQDENVGRILAKLADLHLSEDTVVLYFSDNGPNTARWNGGMKGRKATVDEGGVRSPCVLRFPRKIGGGGKVEPIAGAIDLLPTLASLAGIPCQTRKPIDGSDLSPLLLNLNAPWPERNLFSAWAGKLSVRTQRFRLDAAGRLFDMASDPGQLSACNAQHPALADSLTAAVARWRTDTGLAAATPAKGNAVDPRPFPVGYAEFPITVLPARDAEPRGGLERSAPAPNASYFTHWRSLDAEAVWKIAVHTPGVYEVTADYTCKDGDEGALLRLEFGAAALTAKVAQAWDPPLYDNQDTLPRPKAESRLKPFAPLSLGQINLSAGEGELKLRAIEIPGQAAIDLRRLTLTLRQPG
jgi:arylsulfatase A-like enzyme